MKRLPLSKRKVLSWCIASLLGGVFLIAFAHHRHYFEGSTRWPVIGAVILCWLLISAAVWIAANDRSLDKVEDAFGDKSDDD
jgi:hypothetical protein